MPDIIRLLPDSVANQVAAGEVVQRPSSVVKELMENAVDAGATTIDLIVEDSGKELIQVVDDGKGMTETDARMAFERHATSKLHKASDLFALSTFGFRGEALASIAAVAQVTLRTRSRDSELGTCIDIEACKVKSQEPDACPIGCNFMVRNLFYNIPVQRKFLKSNQTELSNIVQEFQRVALVNPDISFSMVSNGNPYLVLPADGLRQRIASIFGKKVSEGLLHVDVDATMCRITGYVGRPDSAKKRGVPQFFFVNGRYFRSPYFHKAVMDAFEGLLQVSEQIPYFLYFEVDPGSINVNVHPTKTEVKFEEENTLYQIVMVAVKEALGKYNAVPTLDFDVDGKPDDIPVYNPLSNPAGTTKAPTVNFNPDYNPFTSSRSGGGSHTSSRSPVPVDWETLYSDLPKAKSGSSEAPLDQELVMPQLFDVEQESVKELERSAHHYQYRGQYIITTVRSGLMIIDQHRAHVRVLYEKYKSEMRDRKCVGQRLLFPEMVQIPMSDVPLMEEVMDELYSLGFEITNIGGGSFSIQSLPAGIEGLNPQQLLVEMLANLREGGAGMEDELQHRIALMLARNSAIPAGQVMTQEEMEDLVGRLFMTSTPNFTPDGKTIVSIMEHEILEKMFK